MPLIINFLSSMVAILAFDSIDNEWSAQVQQIVGEKERLSQNKATRQSWVYDVEYTLPVSKMGYTQEHKYQYLIY